MALVAVQHGRLMYLMALRTVNIDQMRFVGIYRQLSCELGHVFYFTVTLNTGRHIRRRVGGFRLMTVDTGDIVLLVLAPCLLSYSCDGDARHSQKNDQNDY